MSAFLDASVIVAILAREPDGPAQLGRLAAIEGQIYVSAMALFEATVSLARKKAHEGERPSAVDIAETGAVVKAFLATIGAREMAIDVGVRELAIDAAARFGKVVGHSARLNMGDCFAYACAREKNVPLLYKGDDFAKTDIPSA